MGPPRELPVASLATTPDDAHARHAPGSRRNALPLYALSLVLMATAVAGFIWHDLRQEYRDTLTFWDVRMSNSANDEVRIAALWLKERRTDTEAVGSDPLTARLLSMEAKRDTLSETRRGLEREIARIALVNGFLGGAAADTECRIVAQTGLPEGAVAGVQKVCREAQRARDFRVVVSGMPQAHVWLNLASPVFAPEGASPLGQASRRELGAVVMTAAPWESLFFRLISPEAEPTRTAEPLIVWKEGSEAVFFSPRLFIKGTTPVLRRPVSEPAFESRVAREGNVQFGEFTDYRGVRVFGAARSIGPGRGSLARKVDRYEALVQFRQREWLEWLAGALSVLLFGSVIVAQHRHMAMRDLKEKLGQQQALLDLRRYVEVSEERFRELVESVEAIVWEANAATLHPTFVSQGAERILGFSPAQWLQTPNFWADHLHPQDRERGLACERETLEKGKAFSVEYRMEKADGQFRWFRDFMHLVRGAEGEAKLLRGIMVDMTESKEAELALNASEERYRAFVANSSEGIWRYEGDQPISTALPVEEQIEQLLRFAYVAECNDALARMYGFDHAEEMIGRRLRDRVPDDPRNIDHLRAFIRSGYRLANAETSGKDREGKLHHFANSYVGVVENGYLVRAWGVQRDVTERKKAEEALRESEQFNREVISNAQEGVIVYDREFRYLVWNRFMEELTGMPGAQVLGKNAFDLFPHLREQNVEPLLRRALAGETVQSYDIPYLVAGTAKSGWVSATYSPHVGPNGEIVGVVGIVREISKRRQAEEQLRKLSIAVEQSPACVVITDPQGNIEYVNPKFTSLTGYTLEEALGKNPRILKSGRTPGATYRELWETALSGGVWRGEFENKKKNGEFYWEFASISPIRDAQGAITHLIAVKEDITQRKRAEAELAERLRFETLLAELSARFVNVPAEELNSEIEETLRRVSECLGLDISTLWQVREGGPGSIRLTHYYRGRAGPPLPERMDAREYFPWTFQQAVAEGVKLISFSSLEELPPEAARDRETYRQLGVKSALSIALSAGGGPVIGGLSFNTLGVERPWPEEIVKRLQLVAQMFSNALARQRSDRALRESEERFRGLSNASMEGIMVHDQGLILDANVAFARLFGYERPEELIGRSGLDTIIAPESRASIWERMQRQDTGPLELTCLRKDGATFAAETDSRSVRYLGHNATVVSCRDITERKRAEEALAESRALLNSIVNGTSDLIWSIDAKYLRLLSFNQSFVEFFIQRLGIRAKEGMLPEDFLPTDELKRQWHGFYQRALREGSYTIEYDMKTVPRTLQLSFNVLKRAGVVFAVSVFAKDITERRRAEKELQRSLEQLRALAARLQNIREEERKRVAREIHDQLGQALTAIKLDLSSLARELPAELNHLAERSSPILQLVDGAIQTVRRIATELRPGMLDDLGLVATLEWAAEVFEGRTGTKCRLDLPREEIIIDPAVATAVFRIFQETLTNVARHANASEVEVRLAKQNGDLVLEVRDNGKGFPEDSLSSGESLGILGMRERALLFGGELEISSAEGEGTKVRVRIPAARRAA